MVSACLLGINTKYDGNNNLNDLLKKYSAKGKFIPVCPEQLAGLSTPRLPAEIINGSGLDVLNKGSKVQNIEGEDITAKFVRGAEETLQIAKSMPIKAAILKERSPSCGVRKIYDGSFESTIRDGIGVTTAILQNEGIPVYSEEEITEELIKKLIEQ